MNAEEQVPDGSEQRALAGLVRAVNDMKVARRLGKPEIEVGEGSERGDL